MVERESVPVLRCPCMTIECALQSSLFSDKLVDTRTPKQRQRAQAFVGPMQTGMFSQREMGQFGVNAHPRLDISPKTRLELAMQDPRTDEEKARQIQQQIEENTVPMPWAENRPADEGEGTS